MKNYPKKDGHRRLYVRIPIQITEEMQEKTLTELTPGKWMAVNVMKGGYGYLPAAAEFDTKEKCQKACDVTNKYCGFTKQEVKDIINWSFGTKALPAKEKEVTPKAEKIRAMVRSYHGEEVLAIVRADHWYKDQLQRMAPYIQPKDYVVCQWVELGDSRNKSIEAKITIAICKKAPDAEACFRRNQNIRLEAASRDLKKQNPKKRGSTNKGKR